MTEKKKAMVNKDNFWLALKVYRKLLLNKYLINSNTASQILVSSVVAAGWPLPRLPSTAHPTTMKLSLGPLLFGTQSMSQTIGFVGQFEWQFCAQDISSPTLDPDIMSSCQTAWAFPKLSSSSYKGDREENTKVVLVSLPVLYHRGCKEVLEVRTDHKTAKGKSEMERQSFPVPGKEFNTNIEE